MADPKRLGERSISELGLDIGLDNGTPRPAATLEQVLALGCLSSHRVSE